MAMGAARVRFARWPVDVAASEEKRAVAPTADAELSRPRFPSDA